MCLPSNYPPQPLSKMLMVFTGQRERRERERRERTPAAGAAAEARCYTEPPHGFEEEQRGHCGSLGDG